MKITIAQLNPTIGDIKGNTAKAKEIISRFHKESDLIVFPELFLTGYPPQDLLEKPKFVEAARAALDELLTESNDCPETGILIGLPLREETEKTLYNTAALINRGEILITQHKSLLPTYDVFDEARYFEPARNVNVVPFKSETLGISICEDMWADTELPMKRCYPADPIQALAAKGATIIINVSASPFYVGKDETRFQLIRKHCIKHKLPFVYVNQVGANDELIFDGESLCVDGKGNPIEIFPSFKESIKTIDTDAEGDPNLYSPRDKIGSLNDALVLGVRDYMNKCGFSCAIIGLSGGIDSAVTCCVAVEALGSKNVMGIAMPSPYSSKESTDYALELARNLDIRCEVISISEVFNAYKKSLGEQFQSEDTIDVSLENIQARIRGNILMAFSNKLGCLVLSTGNKSELSVGYCTLYGDMAGGLAVISDVPKTMVYDLAHHINKDKEIIPNGIIERPPSAELRPDQKDEDTLPPYDVLDRILHHYVEKHLSPKEITDLGFDSETVQWVTQAVDRNEYKRKQAAPGLKVTSKAFGMGRRMPVASLGL